MEAGFPTGNEPIVPYIRESNYAVRNAYYFPMRRLLDYLLIYIQQGELHVEADGEKHVFVSGEFCLMQPGTAHDLRADSDTITPFVHMDIFYRPNREEGFPTRPGMLDLTPFGHLLQPKLDDRFGVKVPIKLQPKQPLLFRDNVMGMIQSWLDPDPIRKLEAQAFGTRIVYDILRDHGASASAGTSSPFQWITSYFSFFLAEPLTLADMAKRAHLSPSQFRERFKREFGMPPHRYLVELRLRHAKDLLATTDFTMEKIASYCGFYDVHHFAKLFRRQNGAAPGAYRAALAREPANEQKARGPGLED